MRQDEREGARCRGEEAGVLSQVQKRHGRRGSPERSQPFAQRLPLRDGLGTVLPALLHQQLLESLLAADGETPVSAGRPVSESLVRLDGHGLLEDVEDHSQWVERRTIESLEDAGADLEAVLPPLVHAAERVGAAPHLDVALQAQYARAVLRREGRARQSAHAGSDDDDVVFAGVARQAVAGARIGGLFVLGLDGHVVREGHYLVAGRVLDLVDVFVGSGISIR
mmetsp:Transcript_6916/g.17061  ORF Transcript_6916/g.17061 Transcript_6916/m.17061 type:complete len:224 (-) Transcript_6916:406-1077(-)